MFLGHILKKILLALRILRFALYYDIHSHHHRQAPDLLTLTVIGAHERDKYTPNLAACCLGVHPWYAGEDSWQSDLLWVNDLCLNGNVLAIGEAGLDKLRGGAMPFQEMVFTQQALMAERAQKPLVIHCVRAFNELSRIHKKINPQMPWVLHGFNRKKEILEELLPQGFYFSFGKALLQENSPAAVSFQACPLDRFFLETDDAPLIKIEEIYECAARLKSLKMNELERIIETNFKKNF